MTPQLTTDEQKFTKWKRLRRVFCERTWQFRGFRNQQLLSIWAETRLEAMGRQGLERPNGLNHEGLVGHVREGNLDVIL